MQFDEAVLLSIKKFKEGKMLNKTSEIKDGEVYYTPEYFDGSTPVTMSMNFSGLTVIP